MRYNDKIRQRRMTLAKNMLHSQISKAVCAELGMGKTVCRILGQKENSSEVIRLHIPQNEDDKRELELCIVLAAIKERFRPSPEELLSICTKLCEAAYTDMIERDGVEQRERCLSGIWSVLSGFLHDLGNE
jgi:hypothetical protein